MKVINKKETDSVQLSIFLPAECDDVIKQWHLIGKKKDEVIKGFEKIFVELIESIVD